MCTVLLPPSGNPTAVKYIISYNTAKKKHNYFKSVAYPGILLGGGVQQIQLRTEDRTGIWGRQPPSQGFWRQL